MGKNNKLELNWIGKLNKTDIEPRILLFNKNKHEKNQSFKLFYWGHGFRLGS